MGGVLWDAQARSGLVNPNQKSKVLVRPTKFLAKGCLRNTGTGIKGKLLITRAVGKVVSGTYSLCASVGCYLEHVLA